MRDRFVPAMWTVLVTGRMPVAFMTRRAVRRIRLAHTNGVFIIVIIGVMVQVPVV